MTANTSGTGGTAAAPFVVMAQPREPGKFSGTDDTDVEDWIKLVERVSAFNRWDPTIMLANVPFILKGAALTWYETNGADLTSWDAVKAGLCEVFGKKECRQLAAKKELATRAQTSTEPYVAYIQDVLSLCQRADDGMNEEEKVGHVLKGIADDAFNLLVCKDCNTVDAIIKECRRFELAKSRRITTQFARLPNTAATSTCEAAFLPSPPPPVTRSMDTGPSDNVVTRIVRRELEAMAPAAVPPRMTESNFPTVSLIQAVVREEFANMGIHPVCSVSHHPLRQAPPRAVFRSDYVSSRYRNPAEWRTPDDRPICFNCRRVGHVARYCQRRWFQFPRDNFSPDRFDSTPRRFTSRNQQQPDDSAATSTSRFARSPSPHRRQSRSPQSRRPSSPTTSNRYSPEN